MDYVEIDYLQAEAKLEALSAQYMAAVRVKDYSKARRLLGTMRFICTSARLHLCATFSAIKLAATKSPAAKRIVLENSKKALEHVGPVGELSATGALAPIPKRMVAEGFKVASAEWLASVGAAGSKVLRVGGRVGGHFAGPAAVAFVIKDLSDMTSWAAEKSAQATSARRLAAYADYIDDCDGVPQLGYAEWRVEYQVKPYLNEQSEFFRHLRPLMSVPAFMGA